MTSRPGSTSVILFSMGRHLCTHVHTCFAVTNSVCTCVRMHEHCVCVCVHRGKCMDTSMRFVFPMREVYRSYHALLAHTTISAAPKSHKALRNDIRTHSKDTNTTATPRRKLKSDAKVNRRSLAQNKMLDLPQAAEYTPLTWGNYNPFRGFGRFGRTPKMMWELRSISSIVSEYNI